MEVHAKDIEAATKLLAAHLKELGKRQYYGRTILTFFFENGQLKGNVKIDFQETREFLS